MFRIQSVRPAVKKEKHEAGGPVAGKSGVGENVVSAGSTLGRAEVARWRKDLGESSCRLKLRVHSRLLETVDLARLDALKPAMVSAKVSAAINDTLQSEGLLLTDVDRARLVSEIRLELHRLGPLEALLRDDANTEILVNGHSQVYVRKDGKLHRTDVVFQDDRHLMLIIDRIVSQVGQRIDEASPIVDVRLMDGSRINAIIPPLALDGPSVSIRRFSKERYDISALIAPGLLTPEMASFFEVIIKARLNLLVCGETGSGKTTLLNCLSGFIPGEERIVTIENSAELSLQHSHVVRLETRPAGLDGTGEVTLQDLLKNCLRMRPDRIILDELRGAEVLDLLQAMSAGHEGSLAAIHADGARESLARLETMILLAGSSIPRHAIRQQIAAAINIVVHVTRLPDGSRKAMRVSEINGIETDTIVIRDLFEFVRTGTTVEGEVAGHFRPTGIRSAYADQLEASGFKLDDIKPQPYANAR